MFAGRLEEALRLAQELLEAVRELTAELRAAHKGLR